MKVVISGASGLLGRHLSQFLRERGDEVFALVRREERTANEIRWDPAAEKVDSERLRGMDACINLSGRSIAAPGWNRTTKRAMMESRVGTTSFLSETLADLVDGPRTLINASAVGFYGHCGGVEVNEDRGAGAGFLARMAQQWEAATVAAEQRGVRVVKMRIGVVLAPDGGALRPMLGPFRYGFGGRLGSGRQYMSWIHIKDICGAVGFLLDNAELSGAFNFTAPAPVTNAEWTKSLSQAVNRPAFLHLPEWLLRFFLGQMADELLLASCRAVPHRLLEAGYHFSYDSLETALPELISEPQKM